MRPPQPSLFWPQLNPCVWHVFGAHPAASPANKDAPSAAPSEPPLAFKAEASVKVLNWLPGPLPQDATALASMDTMASEPNQRPR
jgi:hypothetical protein